MGTFTTHLRNNSVNPHLSGRLFLLEALPFADLLRFEGGPRGAGNFHRVPVRARVFLGAYFLAGFCHVTIAALNVEVFRSPFLNVFYIS